MLRMAARKCAKGIGIISKRLSLYLVPLFDKLLDCFSKRACQLCRKSVETCEDYLCGECKTLFDIDFERSSKVIEHKFCQIYFTSLYASESKRLILDYKYHKPYLVHFWSRRLLDFWSRHSDKICKKPYSEFYVIGVPMHSQKLNLRAYDQAQLLAKYFAAVTGYRYLDNFLVRKRNTESLYDKSKKTREEILANIFEINPLIKSRDLSGSRSCLIIVDDITSTGNTFIEATKAASEAACFEQLICLACCGRNFS
jgi:predicted amidophosphoribosyltransferase